MKHQRYKILILTCSIGSGHISAARALAEAIRKVSGRGVQVDIIDFADQLRNIATTTTKKIYLHSLSLSPRIWEALFHHTAAKRWPIKILNAISSPFLSNKLKKLLMQKSPSLLVSTYPLWDILLKQLCTDIPFVSVVTDSISIHGVWTTGNPDYYIVPNEETAQALTKLGVAHAQIKVFGYPVHSRFFRKSSSKDFLLKCKLSPDTRTLLLILSTGISTTKVKRLLAMIEGSLLRQLQLIVICCGKKRWRALLEKTKWPWPTFITGWTNDMPKFLQAADNVLTKAGGATVMECISCEKPMLIIDALPGQEAGNALYVKKHKVGYVLGNDVCDFEKGLRYLFANADKIRKHMRSLQKKDAADRTARFLLSLLQSR